MKTVVFDLETTGFDRARCTIVEAAYVILDDNLQRMDSNIMRFYKEGMHWGTDAQEVHKLSISDLVPYKDEYSRNVRELLRVFYRSDCVGHNIDRFDVSFLTAFMNKEGYEFEVRETFDTMKIYKPVYGTTKLQELVSKLGITDTILERAHKRFFQCEPRMKYHCASWDVTAEAYCYILAKERGLI